MKKHFTGNNPYIIQTPYTDAIKSILHEIHIEIRVSTTTAAVKFELQVIQ